MSTWVKPAAFALLAVFTAAVLTMTTAGPAVSAPGPAPVLVTNSASQPVPVAAQGTTSVAGSVAASQTGTWTVNVAATTPLPVAVQPDAGELVMNSVASSFSAGESAVVLYTVPAGKRLLVEQVAINSYTSSGTIIGGVCRDGFVNCLAIALQNQGAFGSVTRFIGSERVSYFVEPGEQLLGTCTKSVSTGADYCSAMFVGRLVNAS